MTMNPNSRSDWISELPVHFHDCPLSKIAIPGSHNSATFDIKKNSPCAPDAPDQVRNIINVPVLGAAARSVCHSWSVCQTWDFSQQLCQGIRYFDLRIAKKENSDNFHFVHALYGPELETLLTAVSTFLADHSREVVLLDFNHFYGMQEEDHAVLLSLLISHFSPLLVTASDPRRITLKQLWDTGKQIVIFYHHAIAINFEEVWPAHTISSPWANTPKRDECLNFLSKTFSPESAVEDRFMSCQGILTPTTASILGMKGCLKDLVRSFQPHFVSWLEKRRLDAPSQLNIVIADFVELDQFIPVVLSLNCVDKKQTADS